MSYVLKYHELVVGEDIPRLAATAKKRIKTAIETRLQTAPESYGKPLRKSAKAYRKLRVGDYRVIFRIEGKTVKILLIAHRSIVYKQLIDRMLKDFRNS